jgi:hypothetical protein
MDAPDWRDTFNRKEKRRGAANSEPEIQTQSTKHGNNIWNPEK